MNMKVLKINYSYNKISPLLNNIIFFSFKEFKQKIILVFIFRRAVRRFVYENHGLMRRMYGAERHISVLRSEIESNDVEYQSEKWSQESNLKHYKLKKEEFKATHKTTTQAPVTNRTSAPDITTSTGPESTTESDFTTTDFDFETTTEFLTTTIKTETESKPQIFQDTLEKSSTTTEKAQLFYRTKGVLVCSIHFTNVKIVNNVGI